MTKIVGSVLVRNEDVFVERALLNIIDFCDEILVQDHQSTDGTLEILGRLAKRFPKIKVQSIRDPRESSHAIAHLADTNTWVFGVDGDEIYDPAGLARLRTELLAGKYDGWWVIFGNVLHCTEVDSKDGRAAGYLTPPSKSMTKLYNYALLRSVDPNALLRLAGRHDVFHHPELRDRRLNLYEEHGWDDAWFRCLHTCFVPRSSKEPVSSGAARENVSETFNWMRQWKNRFRRITGLAPEKPYKLDKYRRGPLEKFEVPQFFSRDPGISP